ncbi:hypothetical protein Nepgr_027150 [Nepenthes gracilis]|uniref:SAM-dependent MTase RsmB/NOP-type domain-containing protein n=1 Tax=Nepenthes gracilis TaxID=150966 RepID=A0AAD3TB91_NEPGR|nr:hypothetical protein Nepgr_027150 [Nepenthes gracilis]
MGGRGRSRTQRKHFKQSRENVWKRSKPNPQQHSNDGSDNNDDNSNPTWQPFATNNAAFDDYYKEQGIVPPEEWDKFIEFLGKPLPAAFRINSSSHFCSDIRFQLQNDFVKSLQPEFIGGDEAEALRPLPWYPENLAWHSNFSRNQLRKNQTLERFHEFLKQANEIGNITRQEAVSMVPPLFLDVHTDHFVLDMCAAPGSKTFQLLEIIHRCNKAGSLPSGMVVANDIDVQRSNLLIHQMKRMCTANLIVTNHEAQNFPGCDLNKNRPRASEGAAKTLGINQLLFDRVLCDVPCSGDGTLRKAPDLWRKWNAGMGNGLHGLQLQIAMRGISLLKVGGRMVYSTCSLNPVENEAVVAEILRNCGDSVELLDVSNELPQLVRRPGLNKWKVRDKGIWLGLYKDVPKHRRSVVIPSMFPSGRSYADSPDDSYDNGLEETERNGSNVDPACGSQIASSGSVPSSQVIQGEHSSLPLERCIRIVPHDQNSGAFFIAVFHKRSPFPVGREKNDNQHGDLHQRNCEVPEAISGEVIKSENNSDINPADDTGKLKKATQDASLVDEEVHEVDLMDERCKISEENGSGEQQGNEVFCPEKSGDKTKLQIQGRWRGVDPVILFKDETIINHIKAFYGIDDSFPLYGHLVTRNNDNNHVKRIYYISKSVKDVLELNFQVGQLKIASVGLKMFERQTSRDGNASPCSFRISSEGLPLLLPYITKQILHASPVDFRHLLQYNTVKFENFVDAEFGEKASQLMMGCCVVVLREDVRAFSDPMRVNLSTVAIGCWKGRSNMTVMVSTIDCQDLLERLEKCLWSGDTISMQETDTDVSPVQDAQDIKPSDATKIVVREDANGAEVEEEIDAVAPEGVE